MKRIIALFLILFASGILNAQDQVLLTTARMQAGTDEVQFTLRIHCNGEPLYTLSPSQLQIAENSTPVEEFSIIEHASPTARYPISVALVMDASGSMVGAGNAGARSAGHDFVDLMDGVLDEMTVLFFTNTVTLYQQMTTIKPMLHAAVDALYASGATAVWDGAYAGLTEVAQNGVNPKRAVVLLTDGGDNSSTSSPASVIAKANQSGIRVFTVGLGTSINESELKLIAQLTGGLYFQTPDPTQLRLIFSTIANFIGRGFDEYTISYKTPDPAAAQRQLTIAVNACNQSLPAQGYVLQYGTLSTPPLASALPFTLRLDQNVPNPASTSTIFRFSLKSTGSPQPVRLELFDVLGRRIATIFDASISAGSYSVPFETNQLSQGMYVMRLSSGAAVQYRTMLLQR
ncbi:MAG: VWA domain-containing protein [Bacteroidia bacterium]|nr:VWA domain-containing protein [Bacteroidia bacterium]